MRPDYLERYLHEHIPLSSAMEVRVLAIDPDGVTLGAPLAPNINHRDTVFGGSASALAILAGWSFVHVALAALGPHRVVIQRNSMDYSAPMLGDFTARSFVADPDDWRRFLSMVKRKGRARIAVTAVLESDGVRCAMFEGSFVSIRMVG